MVLESDWRWAQIWWLPFWISSSEAEEGAGLALQRDQEGFSIQINKFVQRSSEECLELAELKEWHERLSMNRSGPYQQCGRKKKTKDGSQVPNSEGTTLAV